MIPNTQMPFVCFVCIKFFPVKSQVTTPYLHSNNTHGIPAYQTLTPHLTLRPNQRKRLLSKAETQPLSDLFMLCLSPSQRQSNGALTLLRQIATVLLRNLSHSRRLHNLSRESQSCHPRVPLPQFQLLSRVRQVGRLRPSIHRLLFRRRNRSGRCTR